VRKQYHIRNSARGTLAWDVDRLVTLASNQPAIDLPLGCIRELDEPFWFSLPGDQPTCRRVAEHARLISETDLGYPIILDPEGRVMDGMHRVCKALIEGAATIKAITLAVMPEPDFIGIPVDELPYDPAETDRREDCPPGSHSA
jgi:hypothetical protein